MAAPPSTQPSDEAQSFAREQREAIASEKIDAQAGPEGPIDELVILDVEKGRLVAKLADPDGPEEQVFSVGNDADTLFRLSVRKMGSPPTIFVFRSHLMRFDPVAMRALSVELLPAPTVFNLSITTESPGGTTTVQLIENVPPGFDLDGQPASARLYLARDSGNAENPDPTDGRLNFIEPSFGELIAKHHDDALAMLGEGLTAMRAMHVMAGVGRDEAAAIFDAHRAVSDGDRRELTAIIDMIRDNGSDALAAARDRLRKLGPSATAELTRMPRDHWSPDLALNVDALAAGLLPTGGTRGDGLLTSPSRLIDLLYSPGEQVRRDARATLEVLLHKSISLDAAADPYANIAAIEALRPGQAAQATRPAP